MSLLAERFANAFAFTALGHRPDPGLRADDLTTPAAVARWNEWPTPDQWMAEHGRKENER
jgi:hypothetical protein